MKAPGTLLRISLLVATCGTLTGQTADELLARGKALAAAKKFTEALAALDAALVEAPGNAAAWRWRGHCLTALGRHARALTDLDRAVRLAPADAWSWYARGMAKHHLERLPDAIADYTKALELDPSHHKALEWRGYDRGRLGDHLGAYLDLTSALKLDPENPWVFLARARAASGLGDLRRARQDLQSVVLLDPKDAAAHAQLGFLAVAAGDDSAALASFDEALRFDPRRQDYVRIWRYWLRVKKRRLADTAHQDLPTRGWTGHLAKVVLGEMTRSQLLHRMVASQTRVADIPARRAEAEFYVGLRALIVKRPNRARAHFLETLARGNSTMPEWRAARRLVKP